MNKPVPFPTVLVLTLGLVILFPISFVPHALPRRLFKAYRRVTCILLIHHLPKAKVS